MTRAEHVAAFLSAAEAAHRLASSPQVRDAWGAESACAGMTVGGLAHHLLKQAGNTARALREEPRDVEPIPMLEHYVRAAWVRESQAGRTDPEQDEKDNAAATAGHDAVLEDGRAVLGALPGLLTARRDPDTIFIPWQGWALTTPDFLTTRMMEIVVHSDDLAASVGTPTPEFEEAVIAPVLGLLTGVAVRRHGQDALVRALSRPQRAPATVSAF
jgi:Mycothiol maleylpyruvate isomerase N-terminal domain